MWFGGSKLEVVGPPLQHSLGAVNGNGAGVAMGTTAEEVQRLRLALEQKEASLMRLEGENFLLNTQVQQLQQQLHDASRDANLCFAQLAQALQFLDAGLNSRGPFKPEVDRARVLVAGARRCLRRFATSSAPAGEDHQEQDVGSASALARPGGRAAAPPGGRRSAPRGRPRSPNAPVGHNRSHDNLAHSHLAHPGLAASAAAAIADPRPAVNGMLRPSVKVSDMGSPRAAAVAKDPRVALGRRRGHQSLGGASATAVRGISPGAAAARAPAPPAVCDDAASVKSAKSGHGAAAQDEVDGTSTRGTPRGSEYRKGEDLMSACADGGAAVADVEEMLAMQHQFARHRELLMRVLRKSATLEDKLTGMQDDLIRKDVVIHNLRHEVTTHQQEAALQQQNLEQQQLHFEAQQASMQQQHQMQQLQQLQQLQELQRLLQQQHLQQQLQAQAHLDHLDPLSLSSRSAPALLPAEGA